MQQTSLTPQTRTALARCVAAHQALRSYSAEIALTVRGLPRQRDGKIQVALARPGRLRLACTGPRAARGSVLLVGARGFLYDAYAPLKTYSQKSIPADGDVVQVGLEDTDLLLLPIFATVMSAPKPLEALLELYPNLALTTTNNALIFTQKQGGTLTLRFDARDLLLREVRLTEGDRLAITEVYQNVRPNPNLPATLWRFAPPAGFMDEAERDEVLPPPPKLGPQATRTRSGLEYLDLKVGAGTEATRGCTVTFHYQSALTNGRVFESTREDGSRQPTTLVLPGSQVAALNEALLGMKPGGKRKVVAPPSLVFGNEGAGRLVPPGATIVFLIELLAVQERRS